MRKSLKSNRPSMEESVVKTPSVDAIYGQQMVGDINNTPTHLIFMSNSVVLQQ
ncbi:MAG: hypothetical protein IPH45_19485 [Bacteroidales bacterium]|nr:hypothetical protein [Bacteroidales bacterium]